MSVRCDLDETVAHAGDQAPAFSRVPLGLNVLIEIIDVVRLIAAQRSLHTQLRAAVIEIALASLRQIVVIHAGHEQQRCSANAALIAEVQIHAPVRAVQVDDAAGVQGRRLLRSLGYGLKLRGGAMPGVWRKGRQF